MHFDPEVLSRLKQLEQKYAAMGQNMQSYLEGLLYADYLKYWDYIHLDVLLNLQTPRTSFPDEEIFIVYHQITELYFKLTIKAIKQLTDNPEPLTAADFLKYITRINGYFTHLIQSYEVMIDGMDKEQFLRFRMSLLPASGFQSAQYRIIELLSTDAVNLVYEGVRDKVVADVPTDYYEHLYWKMGGKELATGKKTLTLKQFEEKYTPAFLDLIATYATNNLWQRYCAMPAADRNNEALIHALREMDLNIEVRWPLMHYKSAVRYLQQDPEDIAATGGTNWQKYLPPRFQKIYLFPDLFSAEEKANWGRSSK